MNQPEGQSPSIEQSVAQFGPRRLLRRLCEIIWKDKEWSIWIRLEACHEVGMLWEEFNK